VSEGSGGIVCRQQIALGGLDKVWEGEGNEWGI